MSLKLPVGMRQFTGGDSAVINQIVVGTGLLHCFSGESERRGRGQDYSVAAKAKSCSGSNVVKTSSLGRQVIGSMAGLDVVVVRAAVEGKLAGGSGLAAVGVVSDFVSPQDVCPIVDFGVAVQLVDVAVFFLLQGANGGRIGVLGCGLAGARGA